MLLTRRSIGFAMLGLAAGSPLRARANALTDEERRQGWHLLFDGRTTEGWREITGKPFPGGSWEIENGCLKTIAGAVGRQDLRTVDSYRSFDLQFDWMLRSDGNSGVKYLIQRVDDQVNGDTAQARARGLEYQLADDAGPEATADPRRAAASLYSVIAPSPRIAPAIDSFNHSRLILDDDHVEHWLNGRKVVEYEIGQPEVQARLEALLRRNRNPDASIHRDSPISLQNHSSEVWFRDIKVRRLD